LALVDGEATGWIGLAAPDPLRFGDFLKTLAREAFATSLRILPIPLRFALFAAEMSARIPYAPTIDKERILGLAGTQILDCRDQLRAIGLSVLPVEQGLRHDVIGRKALLNEARVTCGFVLGKRPSADLMRRYVRAVRAVETGAGALPLPRLALAVPMMLRFFEPLGRDTRLAKRLRIATALSEMSIDYATILDADARKTRIKRLVSMTLLVSIELMAFPFRLLLARRT
jgi:hypothetical protein